MHDCSANRPVLFVPGAAAQSGAFTAEILKKMGEINQEPIIFALSNPTSKAECTAQQAYDATEVSAVHRHRSVLCGGRL